eukprot:gene9705-6801_t
MIIFFVVFLRRPFTSSFLNKPYIFIETTNILFIILKRLRYILVDYTTIINIIIPQFFG